MKINSMRIGNIHNQQYPSCPLPPNHSVSVALNLAEQKSRKLKEETLAQFQDNVMQATQEAQCQNWEKALQLIQESISQLPDFNTPNSIFSLREKSRIHRQIMRIADCATVKNWDFINQITALAESLLVPKK